jgi:hypothetical protein
VRCELSILRPEQQAQASERYSAASPQFLSRLSRYERETGALKVR